MVEVGSLDIETALLVVKQSLQLRVDMSEYADGLLHLLPFSKEVILFLPIKFKRKFPSKPSKASAI
jgi:hypothetical protein